MDLSMITTDKEIKWTIDVSKKKIMICKSQI